MAKPIDGFRGDSVDIPFTVGSILGTRSFRISEEGKLTGVTIRDISYQPGENTAVCAMEHTENSKCSENTEGTGDVTTSSDNPHNMNDCEHGFWAYYDEKDYFSDSGTVSGVLEGYGEVIVGKKGFRASKARVRALVAPDSRYYSHYFPTTEIFILACVLLALSSFYAYFLESLNAGKYDFSVFIILLLIPTSLVQAVGAIYRISAFLLERYAMYCSKRGKIKLSSPLHKWMFKKTLVANRLLLKLEQFEKVKSNYPGIPIFSSYADMVKHFPELKEQKRKRKAN